MCMIFLERVFSRYPRLDRMPSPLIYDAQVRLVSTTDTASWNNTKSAMCTCDVCDACNCCAKGLDGEVM